MTTSSMARRTTAAGPNPEEQHVNYRTTERLLNAVNGGNIIRNIEHEYIDRRTSRNVSTTVYAIEDRGFLHLDYDGSLTVTDAGKTWLNRDRHPGPGTNRKPADVTFQSPAVA